MIQKLAVHDAITRSSLGRDSQVLLVTRGERPGSAEGDQVQAFRTYESDIHEQLGVHVEGVEALRVEEVERAVDAHPADVAVVMLSWAVPGEEAEALFERLTYKHPSTRFVFLDYYAPASSPHFGVLPYVDRYVKRQVLRDRSLYQNDYEGGNPFTDHLANKMGYDLDGWHFGSRPDPEYVHKIVRGWNLGVTRRNRDLLASTRWFEKAWKARPLAVHRRFASTTPSRGEWYYRYRDDGLRALEPLSRHYRCTGVERVSRKRYLVEMLLSKIVFSPFGWGELCFRDYEAVCCGSLLVKPSMSHLETRPEIFRAFETYIPIRWDMADLPELCQHYLTHPDEAMAIVANARQVMEEYFHKNGFVHDLESCVAGL